MSIGTFEEEDEREEDISVGFEDLDEELTQATEYTEEPDEVVLEDEGEVVDEEDLLAGEEETVEAKVERLVAERLGNQRVQEQRAPTQEEVLAQLRHYVPDETVAEKLGSEDPQERLAALREYTANIYQHLYAVNQQYGERMRGELTGLVTPLALRAQQQEREQFIRTLGETYPSLKGKGGIVARTMEAMGAQGYLVAGKSREQILKDVALATGRAIKEVDPTFTLTMKKSGKNPSTSQGRVPTRGSGGGSGKSKVPQKGNLPFHQAIGLFGKP